MIVVRFFVRSHPDKAEDVMAALWDVVSPIRALDGVIPFDIGRDLSDPNVFIATEVFEDRAALDRQESLPESPRHSEFSRGRWRRSGKRRSSKSRPRSLGEIEQALRRPA